MKYNFIDMVGFRVGKITVTARAENSKDGSARWRYRCDCGNESATYGDKLRSGKQKSCKCERIAHAKAGNPRRRHGHAAADGVSPEYRSWANMIDRCKNPNNARFHAYGGRGIAVCDRWRNSFDLFLADMGKKPSPMMTIEREKNGEGYSPGNCVWATKKTQARNTRSNKIVHYHGRDMCLAEAVEIAGADYGLVALRIRRGWPLDRAISEPPNG